MFTITPPSPDDPGPRIASAHYSPSERAPFARSGARIDAGERRTPSRWTQAQAYVRRHRLPLHRDVCDLLSDLRIALTPSDPAWGGTAGVVVVTLVVALVGSWLACGGSF